MNNKLDMILSGWRLAVNDRLTETELVLQRHWFRDPDYLQNLKCIVHRIDERNKRNMKWVKEVRWGFVVYEKYYPTVHIDDAEKRITLIDGTAKTKDIAMSVVDRFLIDNGFRLLDKEPQLAILL